MNSPFKRGKKDPKNTTAGSSGPKGGKKPGRMTLIGAGLAIVGLLVAVLVYFNSSSSPAAPAAGGERTAVLVATHDISYRQVVLASDVTLKQMYSSDVPTGAYTAVADLKSKGAMATVNIPAGTPLTASELVTSSDALIGATVPAFLPIPPGYVAMTLPTGEQQGVAGYIQPGDYVIIVATKGAVTRTVYTQIHVIRTGMAQLSTASTSTSQAPTTAASSLTIVVTEWFALRTEPEANNGANADVSKST